MWLASALASIKKELKRHPRPYRTAKGVYSTFRKRRDAYFLSRYLSRFRANRAGCFLSQIGAHDGKTDDLLHSFILKYRWKGVLIQPEQIFSID
jgi:hypothetical protein